MDHDNIKNEEIPISGLLITVVTVVYNNINSLEETILSIINQSYKNIEYIIIYGGSTDGTVDIIRKYNDKINYWKSEPDKGIYDAMNKALNLSNGDFLIFLNAGDTFFSDNTLLEFVRKAHNKNAIYYGNAIYINKLTKEQYWRGGSFNKYRLSKTNICHQTIFFSKKAYHSNSYNLKYNLFADWEYNMQLFRKFHYLHLNQTIAYYDSTGISAINRDPFFEKNLFKIKIYYLGFDTIIYLFYNKIKNSLSNILQ